jgi:hypothetical protein
VNAYSYPTRWRKHAVNGNLVIRVVIFDLEAWKLMHLLSLKVPQRVVV